MAIDTTYPHILKYFGRHSVPGSPESRALLAWFLDNFYRLDDLEIQDSLCDGNGDKGIDGIYISNQLRQVHFFQSQIIKARDKTVGDGKLKQFHGALSQFKSAESAKVTLASANDELKRIADRTSLIQCIEDGFEQFGVYVTNGLADSSATDFLKGQQHLTLFHGKRLSSEFISIDKTEPIATKVKFDISGVESLEHKMGPSLSMVVAPVAASELIKMDGIENGDLFAWNVRQWLGKSTAVNRSVAESIRSTAEHKLFPAFHNGITVLCKELKATESEIKISGYAVVNGCQSLTNLWENQSKITSDLRILTRFIEVEPNSELALKITDHTNNQNGTKERDLQSNNPVQTRLQSEIHKLFPGVHYRIKRGEHPEWPKESVIENELLARIILAFDLEKPEAWSQNYKLFGELHGEIFARPQMTAERAIFLFDAYRAILPKLQLIEDRFFGTYVLTKWLLLYLVRECIATDPVGKQVIAAPKKFLSEPNGRERLKTCVAHVAQSVARLLSAHAKNRYSKPQFDYKKDLKNKEHVADVREKIVPNYQVLLDGGSTASFGEKWELGKPSKRSKTSAKSPTKAAKEFSPS